MNDSNPDISLDLALDSMRSMVESTIRLLPNIAIAIVIVVAALIAGGYAKRLVRRAAGRARLSTGARIVLSRLARWAVIIFGFFVALIIVLPDFTPTSLIGALGVTTIAIGYSEDAERVKALILDVLGRVEGLNASPAPECYLWEFGDSAVILRLRWWSDTSNLEVAQARDRVLTAVKKVLDANGVEIPFPI